MDSQVELVRSSIAWIVVIFFALISFCITIIIVNMKTLVKLISFNKEEWKIFLANTRIWLFLFIIFLLSILFRRHKIDLSFDEVI